MDAQEELVDKIIVEYGNGVKVVEATREHVDYIATNLRQQDITELTAAGHGNIHEKLVSSFESSEEVLVALTPDNIPWVIFGVARITDKIGGIWMVGTDDVLKYKIQFLRKCRDWVKYISSNYPVVTNNVHDKNTESIIWLLWCGAVFTKSFKIEEETFINFIITEEQNV